MRHLAISFLLALALQTSTVFAWGALGENKSTDVPNQIPTTWIRIPADKGFIVWIKKSGTRVCFYTKKNTYLHLGVAASTEDLLKNKHLTELIVEQPEDGVIEMTNLLDTVHLLAFYDICDSLPAVNTIHQQP